MIFPSKVLHAPEAFFIFRFYLYLSLSGVPAETFKRINCLLVADGLADLSWWPLVCGVRDIFFSTADSTV